MTESSDTCNEKKPVILSNREKVVHKVNCIVTKIVNRVNSHLTNNQQSHSEHINLYSISTFMRNKTREIEIL